MDKYKIYVHINKTNRKLYIGQTCRKIVEQRYGKNGNQYKKCPLFYNAIKKYGWNDFEHIVLFDNLSKEMADILEKELIKKYNTTDIEFGYNLNNGGQNTFEYKKIPVYQYTKDGKLVRKWNSAGAVEDEYDEYKFSSISRCCRKECKTYKGFIWSYVELSVKDINNIMNYKGLRKVKQYTKNCEYIKTYNSIKSASEITGSTYGSIQTACQYHGIYVTDKKYRWLYDGDDFDYGNIYLREFEEIDQYDFQGNLVKTWEDITKIVGFDKSGVRQCCKGDVKTAGGYIWRYHNEGLQVDDLEEYLKIYKQSQVKKVAQYTLDDKFLKIWDSSTIASKSLGHKRGDHIRDCCNGKVKTCFGYKWKYCDNEDKISACT